MPIYEFYCPNCHIIMNFFSRSVNTDKRPLCPHCKKQRLQREISLFSTTSGNSGEDDALDGNLPLDESKLEKAIEVLAADAAAVDENDPRAAAGLMRKFSDITGLDFNDGIEDALHRMEQGEDPDVIEAELGDALDAEDPFSVSAKSPKAKGRKRPSGRRLRRDKRLYDL